MSCEWFFLLKISVNSARVHTCWFFLGSYGLESCRNYCFFRIKAKNII